MQKDQDLRRSPLKDRPLRLPGQSIQEEIDNLLDDRLLTYVFFATGIVLVAVLEWLRAIGNTPPNPVGATVIAVVVVVFCGFKIRGIFKRLKQLKLGRDGERIVAEQLDVLKQDGALVFHDVVGDGFNLDHVILSPRGIFVAETKTLSKRNEGSPKVTYDGLVLLVDGLKPDRDPVVQVKANACWLESTLLESTGKRYAARPVVLFPGWWVEWKARGADVWVLEPKQLPGFVRHEPVKISDPDLHLAAFHLSRLVRAS